MSDFNDKEELKKETSEQESEERESLSGQLKDIALTGLATLFMTEDSVRKYLKELKVPKEIIGTALEGASRKKDDVYRVVGNEVGKMLSKVDLVKEMSRFLETHEVNVQAKFSFNPRDKNDTKDK